MTRARDPAVARAGGNRPPPGRVGAHEPPDRMRGRSVAVTPQDRVATERCVRRERRATVPVAGRARFHWNQKPCGSQGASTQADAATPFPTERPSVAKMKRDTRRRRRDAGSMKHAGADSSP
jgi:hypothetical protein